MLFVVLGCCAWGATQQTAFSAPSGENADNEQSRPPIAACQWQVTELSFTTAFEYDDPFDFRQTALVGVFDGPDGEHLEIPGFIDGATTWKIRFTPTRPGRWTYTTRFSRTDDAGLHDRRGILAAAPATGPNPLHQHGGFLRVSKDHRYLTYSDGKPFFWLGDTWWACPTANVPFDNFRKLVDRRVSQGYTVFQAHGHRPIFPDVSADAPPSFAPEKGIGAFQATKQVDADTLRYWRETDRYIEYADQQGLIGVMGFAGHSLLDPISLNDLQRLWHYYIARYGAYPITFLITQEYNAQLGKLEERLPKMLAIGDFIKQTDPYRRAMTVHPWANRRDGRQAWSEPWHDFIMLQAGHNHFPKPSYYIDIFNLRPAKPFVEAESNYEGFRRERFTADAAAIRRTAYSAIQSGSFGFTYGAQGLYGGVLRKDLPGPTSRWGPVLTWKEGLELPGGAQLEHLRACYESVDWWRLMPRPDAVMPAGDVLVKADGDQAFLLYYRSPGGVDANSMLQGTAKNAEYAAQWFNPRDGSRKNLSNELTSGAEGLRLPTRPDQEDWLLILQKQSAR